MGSNILTAIAFFFLGAFVVALLLLGRPTEEELLDQALQRQYAEQQVAELLQEIESRRQAQLENGLVWIPFSPTTLAQLQSTGTPTLVYCKAGWDAAAQITQELVIEGDRVASVLLQRNFVLLLANYTENPPEIDNFLDEVGSTKGHATVVIFSGASEDAPIVLQNSTPRPISVNDLLEVL